MTTLFADRLSVLKLLGVMPDQLAAHNAAGRLRKLLCIAKPRALQGERRLAALFPAAVLVPVAAADRHRLSAAVK